MDLSNDEINFGYEEINETIPINSHMQEDFMIKNDGMYFSSFSNVKSDIIMIENLMDLKDPLLWATFDNDVEDFTLEDMKKLRFKTLELCGEFHKFYVKIKGFGVRENDSRKSRIDGHPTSRSCKCSAEGLCEQKHIDNPNMIREPKHLSKYFCEAEIHFKWIRDIDYWIVTKFESYNKVEFLKHVVNNFLKNVRKEVLQYGDAEFVLTYVEGKKSVNRSLFLRYTKDEDGRFKLVSV